MSDERWEKRARELLISKRWQHDDHVPYTDYAATQAALQLGREMADARAEEIAHMCLREQDIVSGGSYNKACCVCAKLARSTIVAKPKTREAVLEEALREIAAITYPTGEMHPPRGGGHYLPIEIARRALEWKPEPGTIENPLPYGHAWKAGQCEKLP